MWEEVKKLTASDGNVDDQFGWSVALSGETIVVGAPLDDNSNGTDGGSAYAYQYGTSIDDIQEFFEVAASTGDLVGAEPTVTSKGERLKALANMLNTPEYYIESGLIVEACIQLKDAYFRTDGDPKPPDFATGGAASTLAEMIQELRSHLGCP